MSTQTDVRKQIERVILLLHNMRCSSDAQPIRRVLLRQPGVIDVYVNPVLERAYVEFDPALTDKNRLEDVLQHAGYGSKKPKGKIR